MEFSAECPSTNDALSLELERDPGQWPDFSILGTEHQTAGHGRLGRVWETPDGAALTFSVAYRVPAHARAEDLGWISLAAGAAVAQTTRDAGVLAVVKWPNDVLAGGHEKKVCGILVRVVESAGQRYAVIGIGLNVHFTPDQLPVATATSLDIEGAVASREDLAASIVGNLHRALAGLFVPGQPAGATGSADEIRALSATVGRHVRVDLPNGTSFVGTARGVDDTGDLLVESDGRLERVSAGDVVHARLT